ncbi:MAG TPA: acyl-CoA desaturase [Candidatus Acidoferrales bacterium]|nr:acyl-CoA desaturase [Candidatus Acidoferrales bacterium]
MQAKNAFLPDAFRRVIPTPNLSCAAWAYQVFRYCQDAFVLLVSARSGMPNIWPGPLFIHARHRQNATTRKRTLTQPDFGPLCARHSDVLEDGGAEAAVPLVARDTNDYATLRRIVAQARLFDKRGLAYLPRISSNLALMGLSVTLLLLLGNSWWQLLNAALLAFTYAQLGFMVHEAGHHQVFVKRWKNEIVGLLHANLLLGLSYSWWVDKHNRHHRFPNHAGLDPDIDFALLAFSEKQSHAANRYVRFVVRYQAFFFFPLMLLEAFGLRLNSYRFLLRERAPWSRAEWFFLALHNALYFGLIFYALSPGWALSFFLVHQLLFGLYLSLVFAPNHTGMPILDESSELDSLRRQILTARNIKAHPVTDYLCGSLNFQIEHHLFPRVPYYRIPAVQRIVREYCESRGIGYCETTLVEAYRAILLHLHRASAPLRERSPGT